MTTRNVLEDIRAFMTENLDKVNPKAVKKDFDDRKDKDIDNDGDTDSSDKYLHKRRQAISKAMKDEGNAFTKALSAARENGDSTFMCAGKKYEVKEVEELEKDKNKKDIKEGKVLNDIRSFLEEAIDNVKISEEVDKLAVKKYANMKAKIGTLQNNIAKTKDNKFRMKSGGQQKIDGWNRDIENLRDNMKKMVDKYGSGVTKSDTPGFTGGN